MPERGPDASHAGVSLSRKHLKPRLLLVYAAALAGLWIARPTLGSIALGLVPIAIGEGLRLWATGHLHKNDALTVSGAYAYVRHPLYLGTLLIAAGFLAMAHSGLALALFAGVALVFFGYYMPYKDRIEGARLESLYGDAFRRYAVAVPRLIPRFHAYVPLGASADTTQGWRQVRFADNNETGTALVVGLGVLAMLARWAIG